MKYINFEGWISINRNILFFLLLGACLSTEKLSAQSSAYYYESQYQYGFIAKHKPSLAYVIGSNINGIEFSFGKKTNGDKAWQQLYRYPDMGLTFSHFNLGNDSILGVADALSGYLNVPIYASKIFSVNYHIAAGLGYVSKNNLSIGSHINGFANGSLNARLKLYDKLEFIFAFGGFHFSNGAAKMPNLGINVLSARVGLKYIISPNYELKHTDFAPAEKNWHYNIIPFFVLKEANPPGGPLYKSYGLLAETAKTLSLKREIGCGASFAYDPSLERMYFNDSIKNTNKKDYCRFGLHLLHHAYIGRMTVVCQLGAYLYNPYKASGLFYERLGLRYSFTKAFFFNCTLKANMEKADCIELGIGWHI